jgi:hypothetical protein
MSSEKKDTPPSPSNAEPAIAEKPSSHNEVDEKDTSSLALSDPSREKNEPAQPTVVPIQPGPHDAEVPLTKLDSTVRDKEDGSQDPFAHLPEHEAAILRRQVETSDLNVGYLTLFRYATAFDWFVFVVAMFCAIVAGAAMPLMTVSLCPHFTGHSRGTEKSDLLIKFPTPLSRGRSFQLAYISINNKFRRLAP